jgi:hypothetical protein
MSKNLLTIEAFAEWAEKQPADKEYDYLSNHCACGQYAEAIGVQGDFLSILGASKENSFWDIVDTVACRGTRTFGALAKRLRSLSA